jgi:hypothetical protein
MFTFAEVLGEDSLVQNTWKKIKAVQKTEVQQEGKKESN